MSVQARRRHRRAHAVTASKNGASSGRRRPLDAPLSAATPGVVSRRVGARALLADGLELLGDRRRRLVALAALSVASGLVEAAALYLVARMATALAASGDEVELAVGPLPDTTVSAGTAALLAGGLVLLLVGLAVPIARSSARLSEFALVRSRTRFAAAYLRSKWAERSRDSEGHFQLVSGDYTLRSERLVLQVATIVVASCNLMVIGVASLVVAPVVSLLSLAGLGLVGVAFRPLSRRGKSGALGFAAVDKGFAARAAQTSRLGQEVAAFAVTDAVLEELSLEIRRGARQLHRIRFYQRLVPALYQCGALLVVVSLVGAVVVSGTSDAASFGPVLLLLIRGLGYAKQLQNAVQAGNEFTPYVEALRAEQSRLAPPTAARRTASPDRGGMVCFESVDFEYDLGTPVLSSVAFTVSSTDSIALTGPSGAGKSTLVQLILRLREPTAGRISVDGADLREVDPSAWARIAAFVPQDNKLILGTVAENIRFYRAGYSDHDVRVAARAAHLDAEIEATPSGYDTVIGPGAQDLSGGQCQRLGIARALLGRPSILVMDEPTSALDSASELMIRRTLEEMRGTVALVVVAHRQSTIEVCERVLHVEHGTVVELPATVGRPL